MGMKFELNGVDELIKRLKKTRLEVVEKVAPRALRAAARVVADEAKRRAALLDDPVSAENIAKNITIQKARKRNTQADTIKYRVGVRGGGKSNEEEKPPAEKTDKSKKGKETGGDTWYWRLLEFGTIKMEAKPGINLSSESLSALQDAGMESTGIYKTMFLANKAAAFANAIISANEAGAKASAALAHNPPAALAMSKMITGIGYAKAGIIAATGLKGMAHSGLDRVPETGTWLLEKGERVVTSNTSAKLDATLENIRNQNPNNLGGDVYSSINVTVNSDGETESESEVNGTAFANLVKRMVVDIIGREMKPGGTLAKR